MEYPVEYLKWSILKNHVQLFRCTVNPLLSPPPSSPSNKPLPTNKPPLCDRKTCELHILLNRALRRAILMKADLVVSLHAHHLFSGRACSCKKTPVHVDMFFSNYYNLQSVHFE